jgi:hypothetical protein
MIGRKKYYVYNLKVHLTKDADGLMQSVRELRLTPRLFRATRNDVFSLT